MRDLNTRPARRGQGIAGRFLRFGLVGASGVAVNALVLFCLVEGLGWHYAVAALLAIEISTISNYLLNRRWTWKDRDRSWWSLINYHGVTLAGAVVQYVTLVTAVERFGAHYLVASLVGIAAGMTLNFVGNDRLTFRAMGAAGRASARRTARYMLAGTAMLALAAFLEHPWDGFVFRRTVEDWVLSGQSPYQTAQAMPLHAFTGSTYPLAAQWFAYPPVALLAMTAAAGPAVAHDAPLWVVRMLVKVPAIAGALVSARLAYSLVLPRAGQAAAVRTERWLLFGPIALVVAGVWGQFEPMLVAFTLAALVAMDAARWRWAGALFALAVLTKPFALFLAPVWLLHAYRRGGWSSIRQSVASGAAVAIAFCTPFLLSSPSGFWQQVVGMHASRAPSNFSVISLPYYGIRWVMAHMGVGPEVAVAFIGVVSLGLTLAILWATARASSREPADVIHLMKWSVLAFSGALLVSKVVNEQYLFIPFALAVVWAHAAPVADPLARRLVPTLGIGVAVAALVHAFHFILFVPQDVWQVLGNDPVQWIRAINIALLPLAASDLAKAAAVAALLPAGWLLSQAVWEPMRSSLESWRAGAKKRAPHIPAAVIILLAVLLTPGFGGSIQASEPATSHGNVPVLAIVRSDWWNPGNDPAIPAGRWLEVKEPPAHGFYSVTAAKATADAALLADAGVDGVILIVDPGLERQGRAWRMALDRAGIPYTVAIDGDVPALPSWHTALYKPAPVPAHLAPWLERTHGRDVAEEAGLVPLLAAEGTIQSSHAIFEGRSADQLAAFLAGAEQARAAVVVVPWNDFGGLGGVEPTGAGDSWNLLRHWVAHHSDQHAEWNPPLHALKRPVPADVNQTDQIASTPSR